MLGPLMQGFMLVGVLYFYSKSILSLINEYYREDFKIKFEKELKAIEELKKLEELREINENNDKERKGMIINKKDIIPSPTIEGIPDIFHSPERTSLIINCEESPTKNFHSQDLNNGACSRQPRTPTISEKILLQHNELYAPLRYTEKHHSSTSSQDTSSDSSDNTLASDPSEFYYKHSQLHNEENDALNDSDKKPILNQLPVNELHYKQIKNQQVLPASVHDVVSDDDDDDDVENSLPRLTIPPHNNHHHPESGNHPDEIVKKNKMGDDKLNEYKNRIKIKQHLLRQQAYKRRNGILHNDVPINVCTVRRKSVNEMIQYWNRQVSLCDNLKVEENKEMSEGKKRQSIDEMRLNVNGLV